MWKSSVGHQATNNNANEDDEWDTDPDFVVRIIYIPV